MSKLYSTLADVYHEIYQSLFNYDEEFNFYDYHLQANRIKSVVEIGCGTGNLAKRLIAANYQYLGIDLFQEMLDIAVINAPKATFMQGDVRNFVLPSKLDCALITGRSISYLTTNDDILQAFRHLNNSLNLNGLLMFDAIDASQLFLNFKEGKKDELIVAKFKRISENRMNLASGWTWNWASVYYKLDQNNQYQEIGQDFSTLRAFIKYEVELFLNLTGFQLIEVLPKKSYAWDDNFFIAKKISE
jgi:SAM-dependent methyltransferase